MNKINRKKRSIISIILMVTLMTIIGFSQMPLLAQEEQPKIEEQNETQKQSEVQLTADQVNYDKENNQMVFYNNVVIIQEDTVLNAGQATFNVDTKVGQISQDVKLVKEDITIAGETLEAFLNDKRYIFENQVSLIQKRQDDAGQEDNINWTCQKLEIFTDTKNMNATGEVVIQKKDYTITAQEATYNDAEDKMTLTGQVKIEEIENNRQISGDQAIFYVGDDRLEVSGNVKSRILLD